MRTGKHVYNYAEWKRLRNGLTLEEVSQGTGISVAMLGYIENGRRSPSVTTLLRLLDFYGAQVTRIFYLEKLHN